MLTQKLKQINRTRALYGDFLTPALKLKKRKNDTLKNHQKRIEKLYQLELEAAALILGQATLAVDYNGCANRRKTDRATDLLTAAFADAVPE